MNVLKLVFPTKDYKEEVEEYLKEHFDNNEFEIHGDGGLDTIKSFDKWLVKVENDLSEKTVQKGYVPATIFLVVRLKDNKVVGMIQIRHVLNEFLLKQGGHIGYGIRPMERRKGYAKEMLRLALNECIKLDIDKVLITCDKNNVGSAKTIISNGGVLENEILQENGEALQRYWVKV